MKTFEKVIRKRILCITIFASVSGLIILTALFIHYNSNLETTSFLPPEILFGFLAGIEIPFMKRFFTYRKALKDTENLEMLHIKETDERNRFISMKACKSCLYLAGFGLGMAGIISSFINVTVFLTIGVILIAGSVLYVLLLLYYWRA